jgi:diguanylate cyclase (GGDEF)-like protein
MKNDVITQGYMTTAAGADLGLFYQLLEMVDGDWSDSIQGICRHILEKFNAEGVVLSVFDKNYNEFIYIASSITQASEQVLSHNNLSFNNAAVLDIIKRVYSTNKNIPEYGVFSGEEIKRLAEIYFLNDKKHEIKLVNKVITELNIRTIFAIPDIDAHQNYTCFFHIFTDRPDDSMEMQVINDYLPQLNVALEIVFLVRELYIRATHDGLTKLFNHKQGLILLQKEIDRIQRNNNPLTVAMIDLDFFKKVNDTYGHQAGDAVLEYIGEMVPECLRKCDIFSRYGGEEFLLVLPETTKQQALEVLRRIKEKIEKKTFEHGKKKFSVSVSIGVVQYEQGKYVNAQGLVADTDELLYKAKAAGRNKIEH